MSSNWHQRVKSCPIKVIAPILLLSNHLMDFALKVLIVDDSAWLSSNGSSIDFAEKADNETRQMWCQGIPDQDGWFTLTWPPTHEILTCSEDGELTLTGKII